MNRGQIEPDGSWCASHVGSILTASLSCDHEVQEIIEETAMKKGREELETLSLVYLRR